MTKVLAVIGTRPEAVKMAPVVEALREEPTVELKVCVTAQHREMLDGMLELFGIVPDHDLGVMRPQQSLTSTTQAVLDGMERVLVREQPEWVVVQGDTTTVMAASLAAFYQKCRLAHVEAGLRTFDKHSPFPEEINRRVAGVIADLHFAPTEWAAANLRREGVPEERIFVTGNTVIDALRRVGAMPWDPRGSVLETLPRGRRLVLVTAHRSENFGAGMRGIATAVRDIALLHPNAHVIYPVHLNPRARRHAFELLGNCKNVTLTDPLDYRPLVWLLHRIDLVITDSGGLQEEAAAIGKPVLVLRDTTERPEGVDAGIARLVGTSRREIVDVATRLLRDPLEYHAMASVRCPYGDGTAGRQIAELLVGRPPARRKDDDIYEQPEPTHPLDALLRAGAPLEEMLRHATQGIPAEYAEAVIRRFRRRSEDEVVA